MGSTPGNSRPGSPEGTPEEGESATFVFRSFNALNVVTEEARPVDIPVHALPAPEGPFVLADAKEMGIPVFSKPIVAPKMILSNFPKVGHRS